MKFANKTLFVFSLLLSSAFISAQTFDLKESERALNENPAAYVVGGASCYAASIMGGQAAQYVLVSAALAVPAAATFCIPAAALLHTVTLCDSVERLAALYTGHQPIITKYNPTAYLASFLISMFDSSHIFKDPKDSKWNRALEQGQRDMAVIATITNGLVSAWRLLEIGKYIGLPVSTTKMPGVSARYRYKHLLHQYNEALAKFQFVHAKAGVVDTSSPEWMTLVELNHEFEIAEKELVEELQEERVLMNSLMQKLDNLRE